MKPVKKLLIISLTLISIISAVNTTAFATEIDSSGPSTPIAAGPEITVENSAIQYILTVRNLNPAVQINGVSESQAADAVEASISMTADKQPLKTDESLASVISDMQSSIYIPVTVLSVGQEIADFALQYDGYKYVYGAAKPSVGFDCSGLTYYVYNQFGYTLPRTASVQYRNGTAVEKSELQPGDLVFFATYGGRSVTHVGIYIGNNEFINATSTGHGVKICNLDDSYWSKAWVGAKRVINLDNLSVFA